MKQFRTLYADEIEVRAKQVNEYGITLLLYKDARVDQNLLDETVGPMNWQRHHSRDNANCTVAIWDETKGQWIEKEDTGTESNTEAEKGLASDSFKRACFNWGIGRELYTGPKIKLKPDVFKLEEKNGKYYTYDTFEVSQIGYDENRCINRLVLRNKKTKNVVFTYGGEQPAAAPKPAAPEPATQSQEAIKSEQAMAAVGKEKIDAVKISALTTMLQKEGIPIEKINRLYKVETLADLTMTKYSNICNNIENIKKA